MKYPKFFDTIETITLYDELSKFLWVNDDWILEISYLDIVKTAWHSCATVWWAYIIALKWLKELYKDKIPERWNIKVELKRTETDDNTWVIWCVLSNITWATTNYWFWGIPRWKYNRRWLLFYWANIDSDVCFTRLDTNEKVFINYTPQKVVQPMKILMSAIKPDATEEDKKTFPQRFQNMVKTLFENKDKVIEIKKV